MHARDVAIIAPRAGSVVVVKRVAALKASDETAIAARLEAPRLALVDPALFGACVVSGIVDPPALFGACVVSGIVATEAVAGGGGGCGYARF